MQPAFIECRSRNTAARRAPWAATIISVSGGYMAFATRADARTWRRQN